MKKMIFAALAASTFMAGGAHAVPLAAAMQASVPDDVSDGNQADDRARSEGPRREGRGGGGGRWSNGGDSNDGGNRERRADNGGVNGGGWQAPSPPPQVQSVPVYRPAPEPRASWQGTESSVEQPRGRGNRDARNDGSGNWRGGYTPAPQALPQPAPQPEPRWRYGGASRDNGVTVWRGGRDQGGSRDGGNGEGWRNRDRGGSDRGGWQQPVPQAQPAAPPPPQGDWRGGREGRDARDSDRWNRGGGRDSRGWDQGRGDRNDRWDRNDRDGGSRWEGRDRRDNDRWRDNDHDHDRDRWRDNDRRDSYRDRDRWDRNGRRDDWRWDNSWRNDRRYDWYSYRERNRDIYRPGRYYAPDRYYRYNRFSIGITIGSSWYSDRYWINDPWYYRLPEVYGPYRWVRYYDDVLLVDTRNGYVVDVIYDFFW